MSVNLINLQRLAARLCPSVVLTNVRGFSRTLRALDLSFCDAVTPATTVGALVVVLTLLSMGSERWPGCPRNVLTQVCAERTPFAVCWRVLQLVSAPLAVAYETSSSGPHLLHVYSGICAGASHQQYACP